MSDDNEIQNEPNEPVNEQPTSPIPSTPNPPDETAVHDQVEEGDHSESEAEETTSEVEQPPEESPSLPEFEPMPRNTVWNLVDQWWNDHFPGSILGRHTEAWNHVQKAVDDLKNRLAK